MGLVNNILSLKSVSEGAKVLLLAIYCNLDSEGKCWLSDWNLSHILQYHEKSVNRLVSALVSSGMLKRVYDKDRHRYLVPQIHQDTFPIYNIEDFTQTKQGGV